MTDTIQGGPEKFLLRTASSRQLAPIIEERVPKTEPTESPRAVSDETLNAVAEGGVRFFPEEA